MIKLEVGKYIDHCCFAQIMVNKKLNVMVKENLKKNDVPEFIKKRAMHRGNLAENT